MDRQESGKRGGLATRDNHPTVCPLCGSLIKSRFYQEAGQRGGEATFKKYGREGMAARGRLGGRGNKRHGKDMER